MQSLSWYLHRLSRMSPAEVTYRTVQAGKSTAYRLLKPSDEAPAPVLPAAGPPAFVNLEPQLPSAAYVERAEAILAGHAAIFDLTDCRLGWPPRWNRDPLTGTDAPLIHAASLDYRDERLVGNIKYLWEPNRHLQAPPLAQAYALTGEMRYADGVRTLIDSWIEQCPCDRGPNWASSLELGIRLINWSIAWQLLGGFESRLFADPAWQAFRARWLRSVYQHVRAVVRRLSRFSSANNHLIGEAAGVWIAAATWDCWPQMRRWGRRCKRILAAEALRQNAADGGNREQAFAYQQFVLDFLLLAGLAARAAGDDFEPQFWQRLEKMLEFIAAMMNASGQLPMIGDADDGYVVRLDPTPTCDNFRSLLATGAVLFDRPDFLRHTDATDPKTRWLRVDDFAHRGANVPAAAARAPRWQAAERSQDASICARSFPESGYYLMGDRFCTAEEIRLLVDAGPLGYLSIAAHGHADALSVVLSVAGQEVLIDPGTYAYHTQPQWRSYFRGTRAHNTVLIDDEDQSVQSGNFMWSQHARTRCLHFDVAGGLQRFAGEHDGYRRFSDPVTHRREIVFDARTRSFTVADRLTCAAEHRACRHWHVAESVQSSLQGEQLHLRAAGYLIRLVPCEPLAAVEVHRSGSARQGGWVSRSFGRKEPATTVAWHSTVRGTTTLCTRIFIEPARSSSAVAELVKADAAML